MPAPRGGLGRAASANLRHGASTRVSNWIRRDLGRPLAPADYLGCYGHAKAATVSTVPAARSDARAERLDEMPDEARAAVESRTRLEAD